MADLNVTFAGLALKSPLIVEFHDHVPQPQVAAGLADAGAGGLLMPPLNEARLNWAHDESELTEHNRSDAAVRESEKIRRNMNRDAYIESITELSRAASIPIIAALQCSHRNHWLNTARSMSDAGAAAVELHPIVEPDWRTQRSDRVEKEILRIGTAVATRLDMPVTLRLVAAPYGMQALVQSLGESNVKGVILVGSEYLATIDADSGTADSDAVDGRRGDTAFMNALASLQVLYRRVTPHLAAQIPPDRGTALTESILAGATLATLPVRFGEEEKAHRVVEEHLAALHGWMRRKDFSSLFDFRGSLSESRRSSSLENPVASEK